MVCVTGALIIRIWRQTRIARVALVPLVAFQIVWGADSIFYNNSGRIDSAMSLIRSSFEGTTAALMAGYRRPFLEIRDVLPPKARVLLHNAHVSLGIDRELYLDGLGYQALITYDRFRTPADVYRFFVSLGITHLLYEPQGFRAPTKQQEVLWNALIRPAPSIGHYYNYKLLAMPTQPPADEPPWRVATLGLYGYADGIYPIERLNTDELLPSELQHYAGPAEQLAPDDKARAQQLEHVQAVLMSRPDRPKGPVGELLQRQFERSLGGDPFTLYLRK
jgi:hypothetical protein